MIKLALAAMFLATIGCAKRDEPKPATETKPAEAPKPAEPTPTPTPTKDTGATPADPNAPCVIAVKMTDQVTFDGGGVKGESSIAKLDLSPLKQLAGKCTAEITADDAVGYQDIIRVMDTLVGSGITEVGLGGPKSPKIDRPSKPLPGPTITGEWGTTKDGKLQLTGHFSEADKNAALKAAPVIVITKTEVKVSGKAIGKPDDAALAAAISSALPATPKDSMVILQADASLSFAPVRAAIDGAKQAGYDNVLFAVTNK
jgi:biopolymer transport protein ExbD